MGCNPAYCDLLGRSSEDVIGNTDYDFFDKEQADLFRENDEITMESEQRRSIYEWLTYLDGVALLMLTSLGNRGDAKHYKGLGFDGYLTKPIRAMELSWQY